MKVIVIGGGVIGYCSAYYLQKSGHEVTILEKSDASISPSYWNAGMIVPSHFIPLASPGVIAKGLKWMLSSTSPFHIKPRFDKDLVQWLWEFYKHSNSSHVNSSTVLLKDMNQLSNLLFQEIIEENNFNINKKDGLLMVFNTEKGKKEEIETAEKATELGIQAEILNNDALSSLEPNITYRAKGAIHYPGDAFMSPSNFMHSLEMSLINNGVNILKNQKVTGFEQATNLVSSVQTEKEAFQCDKIVLASGIHSFSLGKLLGLYIPMQGGKGYSITVPQPKRLPSICSILTEANVAVTPMNGDLRLAGTMEIAGMNIDINRSRVNGFLSSVVKYMPDYDFENLRSQKVWVGLRPCTPDGLPFLGVSDQIKNLVVCTGHAMMGFSMGPVSGKLVSELINETDTTIMIEKLHPDRYL